MRSSKIFIISSLFLILSNVNYAQAYDLVRLNCTMPRHEDVPERNFQFTLDENNQTVSFYVEDSNATNKEKAFFGDDNVTWSNNIGFVKIKRVISRSNLTLTETTDIGGHIREEIGKCSIIKKKKNKF